MLLLHPHPTVHPFAGSNPVHKGINTAHQGRKVDLFPCQEALQHITCCSSHLFIFISTLSEKARKNANISNNNNKPT